jgi:hypothetical protein
MDVQWPGKCNQYTCMSFCNIKYSSAFNLRAELYLIFFFKVAEGCRYLEHSDIISHTIYINQSDFDRTDPNG